MEQCVDKPPKPDKNESSYNSQASELLAITSAAVSELGYRNDTNDSIPARLTNNQPITEVQPSHTVSGQSRNDDMYVRTFSQRVISSSSASELDILNQSGQSNQSQSSVASSALLNGTAQKVKISSKKLKQIKSPFEISISSVEAHNISNMSLASGNISKPTNNVGMVNCGKEVDVLVEKHQFPNKGGTTHHSKTPNGLLNGDFSKEIVGTITDSGYATHNVQIIHEIEGEQASQNTSNEEVQSLNNYTLESTHDKVIQAIHHAGGSQNSSCTQPEIVTVENGVAVSDVSPGHGISTSSQSSEIAMQEMAESNNYLEDRFSRFQPALLKQGSLESGCGISSSTGKKDQVHIKNFSLDDKQKQMRKQFVKRQQQGPVKKVVQPRIVLAQRQKFGKETVNKQEVTVTNMQDAVETAAVVAASAVAATQPFLKAQQDVESKMAMILQKLAAQEGGDKTTVYKNLLDDKAQLKIEELEQQLNGVTQRRLDYLEKLQEQQMAWQSQLISVSQGHSPQHVLGHSVLKTKQVQHTDRPSPYVAHSASDPTIATKPVYEEIQKEKAVLHTPAPRERPPQPTSMYEELSTPPARIAAPKTGGFLAHILAQQDETPKHSPFPRTPSRSPQRTKNEASPTLKKAHHLLNELTGLNEEVHQALISGSDQCMNKTQTGPAPLDQYMSKVVDIPPSSPYPSRLDVQTGDAPVSDNYADAHATLKEVKKTQGLFEANIQAILRARQESEVYSTLGQLTFGSSPERVRIRKMVDQHIHSMSSDMEREIMDELLRIEEKKHQTIMIPERDTTATKAKSYYRGTRGKTEARVDTGLKRGRSAVDTKVYTTTGKENKPLKTKPKAPKLETASRMSLYGKAAHESHRTTQKHPYLRYRNVPTPKKQPPPQVKTVKGVCVATAKTQTKVTAAKQPLYYYDGKPGPSVAPQSTQSAHGIPTAIPLGVPRRVGSIPLPAQTTKQAVAPSPIGPLHRPPAASTPLVGGTRENVGLLEVREDFSEDSVQDMEDVQKTRPTLSKQILPSVNIDIQPPKSPQRVNEALDKKVARLGLSPSPTHIKESAEPAKPIASARRAETPQTPKSLQQFVTEAKQEVKEALEEAQYLDETFEDEGSEGIALPGYQRPTTRENLGPEFPPQLAPRPELDPASDVIAADIRRRDLLSNKAVSWVEQELMARVISEMSSKRGALTSKKPETVPHTTPVPKRTKKQKYKDDVETVSMASDSASQNDSLIAEALGQEGFQLFLNAGQEVDENLVNALIKEVLQEKVQNAVGQRTSRDDEGMKYSGGGVSRKQKPDKVIAATPRTTTTTTTVQAPNSTTQVKRVASPPMQIPDTPVPTPEPTPKGSPRAASPPRYRVATPPQTPDFTPEPSVVEDRTVRPPAIQPVYYSEEESGPEEVQYQVDTAPKVPVDRPIEPEQMMDTPVNTPPPSPAVVTARTPSPSQQDDYTPIPSEMEESPRQPTPRATPPPLQQTHEPEVKQERTLPREPVPIEKEVLERGQQYSPPPAPSSQEEEVTDTETTSWNTVSDTNNDPISEGQWLISQNSEGEIHNGQTELRKRVRQKMVQGNLQLSQEDTLNEALELDQDIMNATHSEGEILDDKKPLMNEPYLMMLANMKPHKYGVPYMGHHPKMHRDRSLGEVTDYLQQGAKGYGKNGRGRAINVTRQPAEDLESPGELQNGFVPPLQEKKWSREEEPISSPEQIASPPPEAPPNLRTITVRPTTPEEQQKQGVGASGAGAIHQGAGSPGARRFTSSQPSGGMSRPKGRDSRNGPGGRSLSPGLRPQVSAGGRPPSPDKRLQRRDEGRRSFEGLYGTTSERDSLTMTPDQMNVDILLNSQDYLGNTRSDLLTTDDFQQTGDQPGGQTMTRSFDQSEEIQVVVRNRQSYDISDQSYRTGDDFDLVDSTRLNLRLAETPGSTSDMSLPEGLTQTLEREESEKLSFTVDSESDLKMSGKYPDSLEGTGNSHISDKRIMRTDAGSSSTRKGPVNVPVAVMEEEDVSEDNDLSHLSFT